MAPVVFGERVREALAGWEVHKAQSREGMAMAQPAPTDLLAPRGSTSLARLSWHSGLTGVPPTPWQGQKGLWNGAGPVGWQGHQEQGWQLSHSPVRGLLI